jgi:hypothetical protein
LVVGLLVAHPAERDEDNEEQENITLTRKESSLLRRMDTAAKTNGANHVALAALQHEFKDEATVFAKQEFEAQNFGHETEGSLAQIQQHTPPETAPQTPRLVGNFAVRAQGSYTKRKARTLATAERAERTATQRASAEARFRARAMAQDRAERTARARASADSASSRIDQAEPPASTGGFSDSGNDEASSTASSAFNGSVDCRQAVTAFCKIQCLANKARAEAARAEVEAKAEAEAAAAAGIGFAHLGSEVSKGRGNLEKAEAKAKVKEEAEAKAKAKVKEECRNTHSCEHNVVC